MNILNNVTFKQFQKLLDKHPHINDMFTHVIENPPPENSTAAAYGLPGSIVETLISVHGKDKVCEMIQVGLGLKSAINLDKGFDGNYIAFADEGAELRAAPAEAGRKISLLLFNQLVKTDPEKTKGVKNDGAIAILICAEVLDKKVAKGLDKNARGFVKDFLYDSLSMENAIDNNVLRFNVTSSMGETFGQVAEYKTTSGTPFYAIEAASFNPKKFNAFKHVFTESELEYLAKEMYRDTEGLRDQTGQIIPMFANEHDEGDIKLLFVVPESYVGSELGSGEQWIEGNRQLNHIMDAKLSRLRPQDTAHVKDPAALETLAKMAIVESGFNSKLKVLQDKGVVPVREKASDSPSLG